MHMLECKNLQADVLLQNTALCFREIYPVPTISSTQAVISASGVLLDGSLQVAQNDRSQLCLLQVPSEKP